MTICWRVAPAPIMELNYYYGERNEWAKDWYFPGKIAVLNIAGSVCQNLVSSGTKAPIDFKNFRWQIS